MKFIALVEYDYPVEHKPPVKAELVLHGDRVDAENIVLIGSVGHRVPIKSKWNLDPNKSGIFECDHCRVWKVAKTKYCSECGAFMINWRDEE